MHEKGEAEVHEKVSPKLILITGAPGVGKTAAAARLSRLLDDSAWLDGDDVWRIHSFRVDTHTVDVAERNIAAVLRNFLSGGFSHVILSWVLHKQPIIDRILGALDGVPFEARVFTFVCDEATLEERWKRSHPGEMPGELPFQRLMESRDLESVKIDTTGIGPEQVARRLHAMITGDGTDRAREI